MRHRHFLLSVAVCALLTGGTHVFADDGSELSPIASAEALISRIQQKDFGALQEHYLEDAILMPPGQENVLDAVAIVQFWRNNLSQNDIVFEGTVLECLDGEQLALCHVEYRLEVPSGEADSERLYGNMLIAMQMSPSWRVRWHMFNAIPNISD
ncbi:MAG: YybH family protein [Paracoccaceae bacterium]